MKNKKLKYALIIIGVLLGIALVVLYVIFPNETKERITLVWNLLNTPLPTVGISLVAILFFVWKVIKYIRDVKPHEELAQMRSQYNDYVAKSEEEKQALKDQNNELKGYIAHICELSTNQKIKNYGKELLGYGREETTNSETKVD